MAVAVALWSVLDALDLARRAEWKSRGPPMPVKPRINWGDDGGA